MGSHRVKIAQLPTANRKAILRLQDLVV